MADLSKVQHPAQPHVVTGVSFARGASEVSCGCGWRCRGEDPESIAELFAAHRLAATNPGVRSRRVSSLGLPDPSGTYNARSKVQGEVSAAP
jgi:hypothetical protein